jgi:hypothetical protein
MQRRSFLGSLLGLAAAPALAQLSPILSPAVSMEMAPPLILPTIEGTGFAIELGVNAAPVPGVVRLLRTAADKSWRPQIMLQINTSPGHWALWRSSPGNEIAFSPSYPIAAVFPPGFSGTMTWQSRDGSRWLRTFQADGRVFDTPIWWGRIA